MQDPNPAVEPSRRRPPRRRSPEAIPIPEVTSASRAVKLKEVLAAHQQAIEERLEQLLADLGDKMATAAREAVGEALPTRGPDGADVARGALAHAEERFQAMGMQLHRIEEALRRLGDAPPATEPEALQGDLTLRVEALVQTMEELRDEHRRAVEDLGRRIGSGMVALTRALQSELERKLQDELEGLRTSIGSLHRTLAWEGVTRPARDTPQ